MQRSQASKLVARLVAAYPHAKANEATFNLYVDKLAGLDLEVGRQAVEHCIDTLKFLPAVAELMAAVQTLTQPPLLDAAEAWEYAIGWAGNGSYGPPPPTRELWGRCCYAVGLERMCQEAPRFVMPRFLELYREMAATEAQRQQLAVLGATAEARALPSRVQALVDDLT